MAMHVITGPGELKRIFELIILHARVYYKMSVNFVCSILIDNGHFSTGKAFYN